MKDKQMMKIIQQKANEKHIPSVLESIQSTLEQIPVSKPTYQLSKKYSLFKPLNVALSVAFTASIVLIFTLFMNTNTPTFDLFEDTEVGTQVLLSLVNTSEFAYIELNDQTNDENILLDMDVTEASIESEIDEVTNYMYFMETILSNASLDYQVQINGDQVKVDFSSKDILDNMYTYTFTYQQEKVDENYQLVGSFQFNDQTIDVEVVVDPVQNTFHTMYQVGPGETLETDYQYQSLMHQYRLRKMIANEIAFESQVQYETNSSATLSFISGDTVGDYTFSLTGDVITGRSMMINYIISQIEQGYIDLEIDSEDLENYIMNVHPHNRPSFIIEKDRPSGPHGPRMR